MNGRTLLIAFGSGAAIGAAIALLYAPQSGVVTRKKIRHGIEDAGDYLENAGDYLKDQAEKLSKEAQKAIKLSKNYADSTVDTANDFLASAAKSVKQVSSMIS